MGDLSPHFSKAEFACKCGCGEDRVNPELLYALEAVREKFGAEVKITSGCRCSSWNMKNGGAKDSRHLPRERGCDAADIHVKGAAPGEVADYCEELVRGRGGVGRYGAWTHLDVRGAKARWIG